jgi:transcriptional regulator with XRE-family HTH domain
MRRGAYSFVRANRRRWGLTQPELALLIGLTSSTAVSRIERAKRTPAAPTLIACCIVFGIVTPDLFPSLHAEIEAAVTEAARALLAQLDGRTDKQSVRRRQLLVDMVTRISNDKSVEEV